MPTDLVTRGRFRDKELIIKRYINSSSLLSFYFTSLISEAIQQRPVGRSISVVAN